MFITAGPPKEALDVIRDGRQDQQHDENTKEKVHHHEENILPNPDSNSRPKAVRGPAGIP